MKSRVDAEHAEQEDDARHAEEMVGLQNDVDDFDDSQIIDEVP